MTDLKYALVVVALISACGGEESDTIDQRAILPEAPAGGKRLLMPEINIEAGQERQLCVYVTLDNDEPMWISSFKSHQGSSGHHLVAFTTLETEPDGKTIDCSTGERMVFWRLLFSPKARDEAFALPEGYAIKVEPRAKLVLQMHYVNTTAKRMVTRDALDLVPYVSPTGVEPISVAPFVVGSADFELAPLATLSQTYECTAQEDMSVIGALGHMHEWGTSVRIVAGPPANPQMIYAADPWTAEYRDQAPYLEWPTTQPLRLAKNDVVRVTCAWKSTLDETIEFPKEMCAGVLWFYPAAGPITCQGTVVE